MREIVEIEGFTFVFDRTESLDDLRKKLTHFYHWARHQGEKEERARNDNN